MAVPATKPFDAWYFPDPPSSEPVDGERFVYVGCVHETTDYIVERLALVAKDPPDYLIFGGDVTGSTELETFKRLFYNHVYNRARGEIGIGTEQEARVTDDELLAYVGHTPPRPGHTLKDGYQDLMRYQYALEGDSAAQAMLRVAQLTNSEISDGIRHLARNYTYFGPWVKTLPQSVREGVVRTLQSDANKLLSAIQPIAQRGANIIMVGGNWDNAEVTREAMAGDGVAVFDTIPFFREHGITFFDEIGYLITETTVHIFLPYWELARGLVQDNSEAAGRRLNNAMAQTFYGYFEGKTVIAVAHAEPSWLSHNVLSTLQPTGDRKVSINALGACLARVQPDEIIYPHQHNLLRDAENNELPANTKYVLRHNANGVELVTDRSQFDHERNIIATYIPYQRLATLTVPRTGNPCPKLFGGTRDSGYVT